MEALSPVQFFAVPEHAVADPDRQRNAWLWYSDCLVDLSLGVFVVARNGTITFEPSNDDDSED